MSSKPALKPAQTAGLLCGMAATAFSYRWLYSMHKTAVLAAKAGTEPSGTLAAYYPKVAISTYYPGILLQLKPYPLIYWGVDYCVIPILILFIVTIVVRSILDLIFEKPSVSLLEDPEFESLHKGVVTPPINHLEAILAVLPPRDMSGMVRDIALGVIDPKTPQSISSDIIDRPSSLDEIDSNMAIALAPGKRKR